MSNRSLRTYFFHPSKPSDSMCTKYVWWGYCCTVVSNISWCYSHGISHRLVPPRKPLQIEKKKKSKRVNTYVNFHCCAQFYGCHGTLPATTVPKSVRGQCICPNSFRKANLDIQGHDPPHQHGVGSKSRHVLVEPGLFPPERLDAQSHELAHLWGKKKKKRVKLNFVAR